jgi:serine/threonine-protein kinase
LPDLIARILDGDTPVPSVVLPGLPPSFDRWFARANAKDRDARFQTAHDLAAPFLPS